MGNPGIERLLEIQEVLKNRQATLSPAGSYQYEGYGQTFTLPEGGGQCDYVAKFVEDREVLELGLFNHTPAHWEKGYARDLGSLTLKARSKQVEVDVFLREENVPAAGEFGQWLVAAAYARRQQRIQNAGAKEEMHKQWSDDHQRLNSYLYSSKDIGWLRDTVQAMGLTYRALRSNRKYQALARGALCSPSVADLEDLYNLATKPGGFFLYTNQVSHMTPPYNLATRRVPES